MRRLTNTKNTSRTWRTRPGLRRITAAAGGRAGRARAEDRKVERAEATTIVENTATTIAFTTGQGWAFVVRSA